MCSNIESGTKAYMSLYPEGSTDGGIRLGNIVPDFGEWIVRFCEGWPMVMACAPHLLHTMCSHAFLVFVIAEMDTTHGKFDSFHEWKKGKWAILFSHPADFTVSVAIVQCIFMWAGRQYGSDIVSCHLPIIQPVCTTEIGRLALKYDYLETLGVKVATLSVDPVKSHEVS